MVFEMIGTAKKNENKHGKLFIVKVIETIWNCREKNENNDGKWCILTVFETIWNFYVKTCGCSPPPLYFYCIFVYFIVLTF